MFSTAVTRRCSEAIDRQTVARLWTGSMLKSSKANASHPIQANRLAQDGYGSSRCRRARQASAVRRSVPRCFIASTELAETPSSPAHLASDRARPADFMSASQRVKASESIFVGPAMCSGRIRGRFGALSLVDGAKATPFRDKIMDAYDFSVVGAPVNGPPSTPDDGPPLGPLLNLKTRFHRQPRSMQRSFRGVRHRMRL